MKKWYDLIKQKWIEEGAEYKYMFVVFDPDTGCKYPLYTNEVSTGINLIKFENLTLVERVNL